MPIKKKTKTFSDDEDLSSDNNMEILEESEKDSEDELLLKPKKRKSISQSASRSNKPKSNITSYIETSKSPRTSKTSKITSLEEITDEEDEVIAKESEEDDDFDDDEIITPRKTPKKENKIENKTKTNKRTVKAKKVSSKSRKSEWCEKDDEDDDSVVGDEDDDGNLDEEDDEEEDSKPKRGRKSTSSSTTSATTKRGGKRKKSKSYDSDDDDEILISKKGYSKEQVKYKSSAEFFAENQNIAGFDNAGKALYTSIREMVENSLDATESIQILPDISIKIEELTTNQFNELRGIKTLTRNDESLYSTTTSLSKDNDNSTTEEKKANSNNRNTTYYYRLTVKDNGIGMEHNKIGDMFGRVLSGSKYGVRQCRGKFGLGAKMALIWSKKSTGLPISIKTGYSDKPKQYPLKISSVVLDINIHTNEPNILENIL